MILNELSSNGVEDQNDDITILVNRDHVWSSTLAVLTTRSLYALINCDFNIKYENERGYAFYTYI